GASLYADGLDVCRVRARHAERPLVRLRARARVPLLAPRPGPRWDRARLPDRPAGRAGARGRLPRRPDAHELRPPPLRLEPRAAARLRRGVRRVARVRAAALAV